MSNQKHTPAPWHANTSHGSKTTSPGIIVAASGQNQGIAYLGTPSWCSHDEVWANALLIAAAPEMLEALRAASDILMSVRVEVYHNRKKYPRVEKTIDLIKLVMKKAIGDKA